MAASDITVQTYGEFVANEHAMQCTDYALRFCAEARYDALVAGLIIGCLLGALCAIIGRRVYGRIQSHLS